MSLFSIASIPHNKSQYSSGIKYILRAFAFHECYTSHTCATQYILTMTQTVGFMLNNEKNKNFRGVTEQNNYVKAIVLQSHYKGCEIVLLADL